MAYIGPDDLTPFASIDASKAQAMIADAVAQAQLAAPCLTDEDNLTDPQKAAVKSILRSAILRWNDAGSGALQMQTAGPFQQTVDTRQTRRALFWPSEIEQLQKVCEQVTGGSGGAFTVDTAPTCSARHDEVCSINFGASDCSCGADIAGFPLWGGGG